MRIAKIILLSVILLTALLPAVRFSVAYLPDPLLKGYSRQEPRPDAKYFTWRRWFAGDFQQTTLKRMNDHTGFRNTLVRVRNQSDFLLFGETHAPGFILGKQGWLFEEDYIYEYTGRYFIGARAIDLKVARLKNVMDSLAAHRIPLILVFEPGKASFCPEYIPSRYHPEKRTLSNYEYFTRRAAETGLAFLDLNRWFRQLKDTARYPLFPKYGMHWSMYGAHLAADTLAGTIARRTGAILPAFPVSRLHFSGRSIGSDYDIGELFNLVFPLPETPGVYPIVNFRGLPDGTLPALVVADSYYITLVESYGKKMFGKQDYWYYNNSLYPYQNEVPPRRIDKSDLRAKLLQYRAVLLMVSEINLHCGFWNFADEAYRAFHPEVKDTKLDDFENAIRNEREWFRFMVKKATEQQRPLEEVIRADAEYMFVSNYHSLEGKGRLDTIHYIRIGIRSNKKWMKNVEQKARDWNIPADSVMLLDAIYSYDQSKKKP